MNDYVAVVSLIGSLIGILAVTVGQFKKYWTSDNVVTNPWVYYVLLFNLVITTLLPITIAWEFESTTGSEPYKTFTFYCKQYPHIVIYPALLFGFAGLFTLRAASLRWTISRRTVVIRVLIAAAGAFFAMYYEATGGYMMLFEFNKETQAASKQFQSPDVKKKLQTLGLADAFEVPMATQVADAIATSSGDAPIARILGYPF